MASEHEEQVALMEWAAYQANAAPELGLLFAIPNGGDRHPAVAAKLKAEGVKAGVPDLMLPVARGPYHGAFVELKVGRNRPHAAQLEWIERLRRQGYYAVVCHGFDEARQAIEDYLSLPRPSVVYWTAEATNG